MTTKIQPTSQETPPEVEIAEEEAEEVAPEGEEIEEEAPKPEAKKVTHIKLPKEKFEARIAAAKTAAAKDLLKVAGVKDADELSAKLNKLKEIEEASLSETEKLKLRLEEKETEAKQWKELAERMNADQKASDVEKAIDAAALAAGANKDDLDVIRVKTEKFIADLEDDEEVTSETLAEFMGNLKAKKPSLFEASEQPVSTGAKKKQPNPAPQAPTTPGSGKSALDMSKSEFAAYKKSLGLD